MIRDLNSPEFYLTSAILSHLSEFRRVQTNFAKMVSLKPKIHFNSFPSQVKNVTDTRFIFNLTVLFIKKV
jgi:hypothetical protein